MSFKSRTSSNKPAFQSQDYRRQKPHHTHFLDDYQPSLFVSPIECNVSRGCLMDYFEQFGRVRSVTVKQGKFHDFAIIHFDHWHLQFSERLREDLYNGVPARLFYEDRRRDRHTWKVSEYKERERQSKLAASPAIKAPVVIQTAPAPTDEELRIAKSTETTLKVEKSLAKVTSSVRKTRFSPKVEVAVPQAQEVLDEAEAFLAETFSQLRLDKEAGQVSPVVQEDEEEVSAYEQFSADNSSTEQVVFKVDYGEVPPARKRGRKIIIKKL